MLFRSSGIFYPTILDTDDYIVFSDFTLNVTKKFINIDIYSLNEYLSEEFDNHFPNVNGCFESDLQTMTTTFPSEVINYSDRFKHIYDNAPNTNGPMILIIKSSLPTEMRFCNQQKGEVYASTITNVVSINLNQFSIGFPFSLVGNEFIVDGNQLRNIEFTIVDIYNNPIEFHGDLIWTFNIERIESFLLIK